MKLDRWRSPFLFLILSWIGEWEGRQVTFQYIDSWMSERRKWEKRRAACIHCFLTFSFCGFKRDLPVFRRSNPLSSGVWEMTTRLYISPTYPEREKKIKEKKGKHWLGVLGVSYERWILFAVIVLVPPHSLFSSWGCSLGRECSRKKM